MKDENSDPRFLALKVVMMPKDTNRHGTIFGGVLLSNIDLAGAVGAYHETRRLGCIDKPLVTVGMKSVEFHQPVFVGDALSFWTQLLSLGTSSITMRVEVEADRGGEGEKLTQAEVTYVAVKMKGAQRHPIPIRDE